MRILHMFFIGIAMTTLLACNDSSTTAENNSAGQNERVADANITGGQQDNRGPLGEIIDYADVAVHGTVDSIDTVYSNDELQVPHTVVNIKISETIVGDYQDLDSGIISARFVGDKFADGTGRQVFASDSPEISVGDEVVALITERDNHPCTFTQCANGVFQIKNGNVIAENGAAVVVDKGHNVRFVSKGAQATGQYKGLMDQGSLDNFKAHLANLAKSSSAKAKSQRKALTKFDKSQPFTASPSLTTASVGPTTNEENAAQEAQAKKAAAKHFASLSAQDQWEINAVEANGGNPVLPNTYLGEGQQ